MAKQQAQKLPLAPVKGGAPRSDRHWKPDDERKDLTIRVRVTEKQKAMLTAAAKAQGYDELSEWIRAKLLEQAELVEASAQSGTRVRAKPQQSQTPARKQGASR